VYGVVLFVGSIANGQLRKWEGPYKIQIQVGDYVITYGHMDGYTTLKKDDPVKPDTIIGGVGNMGGDPSSNEIDHIHLEIRGPGGWAGNSYNPLNFMPQALVQDLIEVATNQQTEIEMGRFYDGRNTFIYTNDPFLNPPSYHRMEVDFPY
jgi:murein DD-endopeptidase MepM/ murein hydrolase activator NlpD